MTAESRGTLHKGLELLRLIGASELSGNGAPLGTRLADELGLDPAQVSRMLKELVQLDFVELDSQSRGYRLGAGYFKLASLSVHTQVAERAQPTLRSLVVELEIPAWVSVLLGASQITVAAENPVASTHTSAVVGRRSPTWCTGPGRALLLDLTDEKIEEIFAGQTFVGSGPRGPRSLTELMTRVIEDRKSGIVVADGDFEFESVEVSVPIRNESGATVAALSVAAQRRNFARRSTEIDRAIRAAALALG